jgi:hypothetical protein
MGIGRKRLLSLAVVLMRVAAHSDVQGQEIVASAAPGAARADDLPELLRRVGGEEIPGQRPRPIETGDQIVIREKRPRFRIRIAVS